MWLESPAEAKKIKIKYTRILKGPPVVPQTHSTEHTLFVSILKVSYLELILVAKQPGFTTNDASGALCVCVCAGSVMLPG